MLDLLWHYITGPKLQLVIDSGVLLPDVNAQHVRLRNVWFAPDALWRKHAGDVSSEHPTVRMYCSNREKAAREKCGLGRVGVTSEMAPFDWYRCRKDFDAEQLLTVHPRIAPGGIAIYRWFSSEPVASDRWEAVQVWQNSTWSDVPFEKFEQSEFANT